MNNIPPSPASAAATAANVVDLSCDKSEAAAEETVTQKKSVTSGARDDQAASNDHADEDGNDDNASAVGEDDAADGATGDDQGDTGEETAHESGVESEKYRDFYLMGTAAIKEVMGTPPPKRKGPRGGVASAFPVKLHEMLTRGQFDGTDHIVSWTVHGRSFAVHQPTIFVEELMPRYFKQSKMTSFQRQLNLYGFMRKTDGSDRGSYYHELFLRGRPDLAKIMVRTRVKGDNTTNKSRKVMAEPDFFKMPFCPEDPDPRQRERGAPARGSSRGYYNPDTMQSPRGRYEAAPYYSSNAGSAYRRRDPMEGRGARSAPTVAEVTPSTPKSEYISGPPMALSSSSFFLDEHEPPMHAPDNSMWTPPPFPVYETRHHHSRERPRYQVLQASPRSAYPAVVSPNSMEHPPPLAPIRYSTPTRGSSSSARPYHPASSHHYNTSVHYSRRGPPPPRISPSSRQHVYATDRARAHHIMMRPRSSRHQEREDMHMHHYEREMRERSHRRVMPPPAEHTSPRPPPASPHDHHHHQIPHHHSPRPGPAHSSGAPRMPASSSSSTPTNTESDRKRRREWADPAVDGDLVIPYDHKSSTSDLPARPAQRLLRRRSSGSVGFFDADDFEPIDDTSLELLESSLSLAPV